MSERQVIVVGAGPAGAVLALLLASHGVQTLLLERQRDFSREFRGEVMMPSGLAVLDALGIDWTSVAHRRPQVLRIYRKRRLLREIDIDRFTDSFELPVTMSQPHLLEHIVARSNETPGFELVRGATVRGLCEVAGRIVGVRVHAGSEEREIGARLIVGADGRASVVRRRAEFEVEDRGAPMDIVWFKVPWPPSWARVQARGYLGGGHLLIALPAPDGMLQVAWVILKGTYGELRSRGVDAWARAMAEHVDSDLAEHLLETVPHISRAFLLDSVTDRVIGWSRPGVLLIGDAAHTMSPVGGQGLNLALRDAVVAANHLIPVLQEGRNDRDLDQAAARIEPERAPEIDRIQRIAALPPHIVMGRGALHEPLRWAVTSLLASKLGGLIARKTLDLFLHGVTDVELRA